MLDSALLIMLNENMKAKAEFRVTQITENHVQAVKQLIADNPSWSRRRLSMELCRLKELVLSRRANERYGLPRPPA
ncbi:MAG: hypothetical protein ACOY9Y_00010 [Bacillota bacterium]